MLVNCFKNRNSFSWIKLASSLLHLKYWYYKTPTLEFPCLPLHIFQISPGQLKPFFNTTLIMFFIGFSFFPTHIPNYMANQSNLLPSNIQIIIPYWSNILPIKKNWIFMSCFSFKVRQHGQQQLYLQYKVPWILYKILFLFHNLTRTYNLHQKSAPPL